MSRRFDLAGHLPDTASSAEAFAAAANELRIRGHAPVRQGDYFECRRCEMTANVHRAHGYWILSGRAWTWRCPEDQTGFDDATWPSVYDGGPEGGV